MTFEALNVFPQEVISNELEVRVQVQVAKKCQKNLEEQVNQLKKNLKKLENDISTTPKQKKRVSCGSPRVCWYLFSDCLFF